MRWVALAATVAVAGGLLINSTPRGGEANAATAATVRSDPTVRRVLAIAKRLVDSGLSAGTSYPETWIRDLNSFLPYYLSSGGNPSAARAALLTFLAFQRPDGDIPDGYVAARLGGNYPDRWTSPLAPQLVAFKNSVESDQESSLVQAFAGYVRATGDAAVLREQVGGISVGERLDDAMTYLLTVRRDPRRYLVWSGVTVDWGDVQAGTPDPTHLGPSSKRADGIYTNAMASAALGDLATLAGAGSASSRRWAGERQRLDAAVRADLYDARTGHFRAHVYLDGSPFAPSFDESKVVVHGGTAVAAAAGLLTPAEIDTNLRLMEADARRAGSASVGLTVYPPYPASAFAPTLTGSYAMVPYSYQNGGDWDWFGARVVQAAEARGHWSEAYDELRPMISRIVAAGGFYEWWSRSGTGQGSPGYRGAAGEVGSATSTLLQWATATPRS